jgi:sialic acid synthase SpsE
MPYIIAEVGGNHGGDVEKAKEYVRAADDAGADAVKFQAYSAETLIQRDEPPLPLAGDKYDTQFERFKELELTREEWEDLVAEAESFDIDFAASVFDKEWADFVAVQSPFIKLASGDLTNIPLIRHVASLGKPIVLSTGLASIAEIERAVEELPCDRLTLLHCVSAYPTDEPDANLQLIDELQRSFEVLVGYSDHTKGLLACETAAAKGATVIEKHFTLDKSNPVGDHRLSANPEEMAELVKAVDQIDAMHGTKSRRNGPLDAESNLKAQMRRSLATTEDIDAGERLTADTVTALRPESGLSPLRFDEIIGSRVVSDVSAGSILTESDLE